MVSFFGLGRKKKSSQDNTNGNALPKTTAMVAAAAAVHVASAPAPWMLPTSDDKKNNMSSSSSSFHDIPRPPVLGPRPGTSASMRANTSPLLPTYGGNAHEFPPRSDSRNRPRADSHALPRPDMFGMRLGNGSTTSLKRPPPLGGDGLPARPGTSHGEDRSRQWVNPLDVHYGRNATVPAAAKSPKILVESGGRPAGAEEADENKPVVITQVNSSSPPLLSPLEGFAGPPPTTALPSPPRSTKGSRDDGLRPVRPPGGGLPSPAMSTDEGTGLSRSGSGHDKTTDVAGLVGGSAGAGAGAVVSMPKPIGVVIQSVGAKRDTLTISGSRQQSLSMTIEAFEKSLLTAQQESELRARTAAIPGRTTPQIRGDGNGDGDRSRSSSRAGMAPQGLGISNTSQMGPGPPLRPQERRPSPAFAKDIGSRSQSPLGMRGPPPTGPLPSPNIRGGEQRPNPPFAGRPRPQSPMGRGPRSESPMRLPPPQNRAPRTQSPMGRGPLPSPLAPPQQQAQQTPMRSPARTPGARRPTLTSAGVPAPGAPGSPVTEKQMPPFTREPGSAYSTQHSPQFDLEIHRPLPSLSSPTLDFANGPGPVVTTAPPSPIVRTAPVLGASTAPSSPVIRGPIGPLPRRPGADEYGVPLPRSNSDRDVLRGPPKAAVGAHRGNDSPLTSPLRSPAKIDARARDNNNTPQPLVLSPNSPQPPPLQLSPASGPPPSSSKHQQQHSLELSWSFSKEGADATKPSNKFAAPLPSPLFASRDFGGPLSAAVGGSMSSSFSNHNQVNRSNSSGNSNVNTYRNKNLQVPSRGPSPAPSPKFPFNDGKDHDIEEDGISAPPTPDSTNWPLPSSSPNLSHLQPPPPSTSRSRSASAASHWIGGDSISISKTTNNSGLGNTTTITTNNNNNNNNIPGSPFRKHTAEDSQSSNWSRDSPSRPPRAKVPPPLNLFSAQQYAEVIGSSGPYTPSPTRSMTTPIAACDVAAVMAGDGKGLAAHHYQQQQHYQHHPGAIGMARGLSLVHEQQHLWGEHRQPPQQQQQGPSPRRPDHGLVAPTGIADRFGTGFI
ncbi:uncharacterized protein PpBr36_09512 [Pyricularia pennisetigena]|uniref:uncharacterized protein n=1 Tax=Pyricularia pennisetigena TaxID=1578925 RepID=UPI0011511A54|nr:uncharacterized protein PpBr36_09512 [Pyricularia pennisetigena]TLS21946.1 hypothetical protein PpBr36_09512 [Pyricularia pennisetigena]